MKDSGTPARRAAGTGTLAAIAFLSVALLAYALLIVRWAIEIIRVGGATNLGLGLAMLVIPLFGLWLLWNILRHGLAHQKLAAMAREAGRDVDVAGLPTMPSGRIQRDAADQLFAEVKAEFETDPDSWLSAYRLARAYDYAGDRSRAREWMTRAVKMERASH